MAHRPLQAVGARPVAELVVLPPPADAPLQRRTGTTASHDAAATSPAAAGSTRDGAERPGPTADPRQEVGRGSDPGGILATAVYLGGTADMTVGSRYFIVRTDRAIRIQGPIESDPSAIVLERGIEAVDATVSGNALLVTDRGVGRRRLEMAFTLIGGRPLDVLERAILAPMEDESAGEGSTAGHGAA